MSENDPFIMSTPRSRLLSTHVLHMRVGAALCECGLTFNTLRNQYHDVLRDLTEQWSCHVDELITASETVEESLDQVLRVALNDAYEASHLAQVDPGDGVHPPEQDRKWVQRLIDELNLFASGLRARAPQGPSPKEEK